MAGLLSFPVSHGSSKSNKAIEHKNFFLCSRSVENRKIDPCEAQANSPIVQKYFLRRGLVRKMMKKSIFRILRGPRGKFLTQAGPELIRFVKRPLKMLRVKKAKEKLNTGPVWVENSTSDLLKMLENVFLLLFKQLRGKIQFCQAPITSSALPSALCPPGNFKHKQKRFFFLLSSLSTVSSLPKTFYSKKT